MRLYAKQKVFSFGDKYNIYDEAGNSQYTVAGEVFTFGKKLHVYDSGGQEVIYIEQKLFSFMPRYTVYILGKPAVTVYKEVTFFKHRFVLEGTDLRVEGEFMAHQFRLVNGRGQILMQLSKAYLSWGDSYQMEIFDPSHALLCIGINLCIDAVLHDGDDEHIHTGFGMSGPGI